MPSKTLTLEELIALCDELRALVEAGVPLDRHLSQAAEEMPGQLRALAQRMAQGTQRGVSLRQIVESEQLVIPPLLRAVFVAGIASGKLSVALEAFAQMARRVLELRRTITLALIYPLLVLVLVGVLSGLVAQQVVSAYETSLWQQRVSPSWTLRWALNLSMFASQWLWLLVPAALAGFVCWWRFSRTALTLQPPRLARWARRVPWLGTIVLHDRRASLSETLALLLQQHVPLADALEMAADGSGDAQIQSESQKFADALRRGERPAVAMPRGGIISTPTRWILLTFDNQERMVEALRDDAQVHQRRAEILAEWLQVQLPAILSVALGGTATVAYVLSVMLPWYLMLRALGN